MLMSCDQTQIIHYIARFVLKVLKEQYSTDSDNDEIIGQLMVLTQLDWPMEAGLLWQLLQSVQKKETFIYPGLLAYINSIHFNIGIPAIVVVCYLLLLLFMYNP